MSCTLLNLSVELSLAIVEHLEQDDFKAVIKFSSTCHSFRALCAPYVFKSIVLRNDEESGQAIQHIADSTYRSYVKVLHFQGITTIPPDENREGITDYESESDVADDLLPDCVSAILSDLGRFPALEKLIVEFPFSENEWLYGFYHFEDEEPDDCILQAERDNSWRALMAKSFHAVAQNEGSNIKSLELKQVVPKEVSAWNTQSFHDFLGALQSFTISLRGSDNGAGWNINTLEGYLSFLGRLDFHFFDHLTNVTEFSLMAPDEGPIGLEGMRHGHLSLSPQKIHMPHLKSLHLQYVFICPELVDFLIGHADAIETIKFEDCFGGMNGLAENGIRWEYLFDCLADANPSRLKHLEIVPLDPPLLQPWRHEKEGTESEPDEVKLVRRTLEENPERRVFAYATLDDKYGMLFTDDEENVQAFLEGDDQKAYDKLMAIVEVNAAMSKAR